MAEDCPWEPQADTIKAITSSVATTTDKRPNIFMQAS
jgi:hypothetical protein